VIDRNNLAMEGGWTRAYAQYTTDQLFALVSDIESYPAFMPGCLATRIVDRRGRSWRVDNLFGFGPLRGRFTSQAELDPPTGLVVTSSQGPWSSLILKWSLSDAGRGCRIAFNFSATFRSAVLAALARSMAPGLESRVLRAFERRAGELYPVEARTGEPADGPSPRSSPVGGARSDASR
jgi:coenzyme Q-binding protein COQ10